MVALFRPGPMETIPQYIERKHNPQLIQYLDPRMKEYLDFSYGVLVYQDDVLLTAINLAGYSWLEADKLRKAMGKKIPEVMAAEKEKLIKGFVEKGKLSKQLAEKLWKLIEPFAAYGFNKAHAASYGKVAYQTAYMKANFPVEYMAAVLTAEAGDIETISIMVAECKRMNIDVLPPDINESYGDFTALVKENAIRFGLYSIKNFGRGIADSIITERKAGGRYASLSDFLRRVKDQGLNKKGLESLIECGALDSFGEPGAQDGGRGKMLNSIELLLEYHRESTREQAHDSLFSDLGSGATDINLPPAAEASMADRLAWEKELLGLYVSGHPLDRFKDKLAKSPMTLSQLKLKTPGITAIAAGMVESVRMILTRGGDQMAFVKLVDYEGTIEAAIFPKIFSEHRDILKPETVIALKGRLSSRNGELSMVADKLKAL
jgi:DNA polymerase-3 subunit alpha